MLVCSLLQHRRLLLWWRRWRRLLLLLLPLLFLLLFLLLLLLLLHGCSCSLLRPGALRCHGFEHSVLRRGRQALERRCQRASLLLQPGLGCC